MLHFEGRFRCKNTVRVKNVHLDEVLVIYIFIVLTPRSVLGPPGINSIVPEEPCREQTQDVEYTQ